MGLSLLAVPNAWEQRSKPARAEMSVHDLSHTFKRPRDRSWVMNKFVARNVGSHGKEKSQINTPDSALMRELSQVNTVSGQQSWELGCDFPTSYCLKSRAAQGFLLAFWTILVSSFSLSDFWSRCAPFCLFTSTLGQARMLFGLIFCAV